MPEYSVWQWLTIVAVLVTEACFGLHHMVFVIWKVTDFWAKPFWRTDRWHLLSGGGHQPAELAALCWAFPPCSATWRPVVDWWHVLTIVATSLASWVVWQGLKLATGRLGRWGSIWVP